MLKILIGIGLGFFLFTNQSARQTTANILHFSADTLAPEVDGPTPQEQINKVLELHVQSLQRRLLNDRWLSRTAPWLPVPRHRAILSFFELNRYVCVSLTSLT